MKIKVPLRRALAKCMLPSGAERRGELAEKTYLGFELSVMSGIDNAIVGSALSTAHRCRNRFAV